MHAIVHIDGFVGNATSLDRIGRTLALAVLGVERRAAPRAFDRLLYLAVLVTRFLEAHFTHSGARAGRLFHAHVHTAAHHTLLAAVGALLQLFHVALGQTAVGDIARARAFADATRGGSTLRLACRDGVRHNEGLGHVLANAGTVGAHIGEGTPLSEFSPSQFANVVAPHAGFLKHGAMEKERATVGRAEARQSCRATLVQRLRGRGVGAPQCGAFGSAEGLVHVGTRELALGGTLLCATAAFADIGNAGGGRLLTHGGTAIERGQTVAQGGAGRLVTAGTLSATAFSGHVVAAVTAVGDARLALSHTGGGFSEKTLLLT